jgi:ribosomal protein S8
MGRTIQKTSRKKLTKMITNLSKHLYMSINAMNIATSNTTYKLLELFEKNGFIEKKSKKEILRNVNAYNAGKKMCLKNHKHRKGYAYKLKPKGQKLKELLQKPNVPNSTITKFINIKNFKVIKHGTHKGSLPECMR